MRDAQTSSPARPGELLHIAQAVGGEIIRQLTNCEFTHVQADKILKQQGAQSKLKLMAQDVVKKFLLNGGDHSQELILEKEKEWQDFYKRIFGLHIDFSDVVVPVHPSNKNYRIDPKTPKGILVERSENGEYMLIFIPKGLLVKTVYLTMRKTFGRIGKNFWSLKKISSRLVEARSYSNYAEWIYIENSPHLGASFSFGTNATILETMILVLKYFDETGKNFCSNTKIFCEDFEYGYSLSYKQRLRKFFMKYTSVPSFGP